MSCASLVERLKTAGCNPASPRRHRWFESIRTHHAFVAQLAEQSALNRKVAGSLPAGCTMFPCRSMVGQLTLNQRIFVRVEAREPKAGATVMLSPYTAKGGSMLLGELYYEISQTNLLWILEQAVQLHTIEGADPKIQARNFEQMLAGRSMLKITATA